MDDDRHVIRSGPFKGKTIEFAPQVGVEMFQDIADDFMRRIFEMDPEDCLISDESSLYDFSLADDDEAIQRRITAVYGIDVSDLKSGNLLEIFVRVHEVKNREEI